MVKEGLALCLKLDYSEEEAHIPDRVDQQIVKVDHERVVLVMRFGKWWR